MGIWSKAFIFWDAKRPITVSVLNRLSLLMLARESCQRIYDWEHAVDVENGEAGDRFGRFSQGRSAYTVKVQDTLWNRPC